MHEIRAGSPAPYSIARVAAERIFQHFARHHASFPCKEKSTLGPLADPDTAAAFIDTAFWTSLRREEGFVPKISLAFVPPEQTPRPVLFERRLPLTPYSLTRLAPAVERPGIHLGVWPYEDELFVWGATRQLPPFSFVLEVVAPGLLVIKHSRVEESGKFINVAVLQGDEIKVIDQQAATVPDCPALLTSLLGLETQFLASSSVSVLIQLAISMRAHGRGGSLLVVPSSSDIWQESILLPITYSIRPAFGALADVMQVHPQELADDQWQNALRRVVDGIAGLTAVDGATIINDRYELLAFGAKIVRSPNHDIVPQVIITEPVEGVQALVIEPSQIGGTRHLSAAQFAHDQRDAIAMIASQDGRFTVFAWSPCEQMVHAHRIESLLL